MCVHYTPLACSGQEIFADLNKTIAEPLYSAQDQFILEVGGVCISSSYSAGATPERPIATGGSVDETYACLAHPCASVPGTFCLPGLRACRAGGSCDPSSLAGWPEKVLPGPRRLARLRLPARPRFQSWLRR